MNTTATKGCMGCGRDCHTLYCDLCAPSQRSHLDSKFATSRAGKARWNGVNLAASSPSYNKPGRRFAER